ncbi:MAG: HNH endonuclease [Bacillota bacterium]
MPSLSSFQTDESGWLQCALCQRHVPPTLITLHHLTPKQKGGKAEHRTPLCKPCHKQLHAIFSNTELANVYPTIDSLQAAPQLQPFLKWIRKQKPNRNFRTHTSNTHPNTGKRHRRRY